MLLFVGTERQQRMRRKAVHADRDGHCGPPRRELLEHLQVHLEGLPAPAPLLGLRKAQQPRSAELGEHPFGVGLGLLMGVDDRIEHLVADVARKRDQVMGFIRWQQPVDRHELDILVSGRRVCVAAVRADDERDHHQRYTGHLGERRSLRQQERTDDRSRRRKQRQQQREAGSSDRGQHHLVEGVGDRGRQHADADRQEPRPRLGERGWVGHHLVGE